MTPDRNTTHGFVVPDLASLSGSWDCSEVEKRFIHDYLQSIAFNSYDQLVQLCDYLATGDGFAIVEKRMVNVMLRYGSNPFTQAKWKTVFELKRQFDQLAGANIYDLLDGIGPNSLR